jgi:putative transposase
VRYPLFSQPLRTYAVTAVAAPHYYPFKQPEFADLMVQIILRYRKHSSYLLHGFVVMPNHIRLLLTPTETVAQAVLCLKGGFFFAIRDHVQEETWDAIWQEGYAEHRIRDACDYRSHLRNIAIQPKRRNYRDYPYTHLRFAEHLDPWPVLLQ